MGCRVMMKLNSQRADKDLSLAVEGVDRASLCRALKAVGCGEEAEGIDTLCVTDDLLILHTYGGEYQDGYYLSDVVAYDWSGSRLWTLTSILPDVGDRIFNIWLTTPEEALGRGYVEETENLPSIMLACNWEGFLYLVEPYTPALLAKIAGKIK